MKFKKVTALMLAAVMAVLPMAGCGGDKEKETSGESKENGAEASGEYTTTYGEKQFDDVTIKVELFDRSNAPEGSTLTDNRWVEYVQEEMGKVGINVEFVAVPRSDEITKMQTMMASGTAPDLTLTYTIANAADYYNQGGIWDLSEFIDGEDQAKNLKEYLGEDVLNIGRDAEENLYGIVARRATTANTNMFIRKDWLDDLNLEVPTTPDELYQVVKEMVENNPDIKNPIGASFLHLSGGGMSGKRTNVSIAFSKLAADPKEMEIAFGYDYYYDPGYKDYMKWVNKFYNEGLMSQEYYAGTTDDFHSDIVNGQIGFFEDAVNYSTDILRGNLLKTLQENDPEAEIISIPALKNVNDGNQYSATYAPGGLIAFCPKTADAETVEACMTYLDWLCTEEGGFALYHGFEGEHYELDENGVPVVKDSEYNAKDKDWIRTDLFLTGNQGYFTSVEDFNECTAAENPGYKQLVMDNYENAVTGTCVPESNYSAPSEAELSADISIVKDEWLVKCVTCPEAEFDAMYDGMIKALEDAGIKTIIEERTAHFNEIYK